MAKHTVANYQIDNAALTESLDRFVADLDSAKQREEKALRQNLFRVMPRWKHSNYELGEMLNSYQTFFRSAEKTDTFVSFLKQLGFTQATGYRLTAAYRDTEEVNEGIRDYAYSHFIDLSVRKHKSLRETLKKIQGDDAELEKAPGVTQGGRHDASRAAYFYNIAAQKLGEKPKRGRKPKKAPETALERADENARADFGDRLRNYVRSCKDLNMLLPEAVHHLKLEWDSAAA